MDGGTRISSCQARPEKKDIRGFGEKWPREILGVGSTRPVFLKIFFRVSLDELPERGTTRSLELMIFPEIDFLSYFISQCTTDINWQCIFASEFQPHVQIYCCSEVRPSIELYLFH